MQRTTYDTQHPHPICGGWILSLLVAAACVGGVRAADADAEVATVQDPLDAFVHHLGDAQRARVAPIIEAAGTRDTARQKSLTEALLLLNPDLARALDDLKANRPGDALPLLERLAGSPDPFVATHAVWFQVRAFVGFERYEDALAALASVKTNAARYSLLAGDMLYTEGRLHACLLDRAAATTVLQRYLEQFPHAPAERRGAAQELLAEIKGVNSGSLSEVVALMDDSRRRLQLSDCGEITQARQQQIARLLGGVIEQVEEKPTKGGRPAKSPGKGGKPDKGQKPGEKPEEGAKESSLSETDSKVSLEEPDRSGNPDDWAQAYARDREAVQRELQTRLPERYRDLIEQYYRSLASEDLPSDDAKK